MGKILLLGVFAGVLIGVFQRIILKPRLVCEYTHHVFPPSEKTVHNLSTTMRSAIIENIEKMGSHLILDGHVQILGNTTMKIFVKNTGKTKCTNIRLGVKYHALCQRWVSFSPNLDVPAERRDVVSSPRRQVNDPDEEIPTIRTLAPGESGIITISWANNANTFPGNTVKAFPRPIIEFLRSDQGICCNVKHMEWKDLTNKIQESMPGLQTYKSYDVSESYEFWKARVRVKSTGRLLELRGGLKTSTEIFE